MLYTKLYSGLVWGDDNGSFAFQKLAGGKIFLLIPFHQNTNGDEVVGPQGISIRINNIRPKIPDNKLEFDATIIGRPPAGIKKGTFTFTFQSGLYCWELPLGLVSERYAPTSVLKCWGRHVK